MLATLFGRISHRKAIRVSVAYAIVASLAALGVYAAPYFIKAPAWISPVPLYLAGGFPVVVLLAWIFDRPKIVATGAGAASEELRRLRTGRKIDYAVMVVLLGLVGGLVVYRPAELHDVLPVDAGDLGSVAVLAFTSSDPVVEYVADGLAEELRHRLERVAGLEVASGQYSYRYKTTQKTAAEIGDELGVDTVLWGSIQRNDEVLQVKAHLTVSSGDIVPLWSVTLDGALEDVDRLREDIAQGVISALAQGLLWSAPELPRAEPVDREAYRDYLKARHVQRLEARRSGTFIRELYESAIEADPSFARAYSDYAAFLYWSGLPLGLSERESYAIAREILYAVNRADPERRRATRWLDDALLARIDGNWEGEEYALRQQILAPSAYQPPDHSVYEQYGALLLRSGLFDEALRYCDLALIHDPDNTSVMGLRGVAYLTLGKFDKALEAFDHALALTPSMFELHQMRAVALLGLDKVDEAAEEWDYFYASHRVRLHFARGERAQAWKVLEKAIDDLDADSNLAGMRSEEIGYGFALLGALDRAFEWWQRALEYGPPRMQAIRYSRVPFRAAADARYTELLEAVGLTDEWRHELCSRVALLEPVTGVEANCISVLASIE